jgi:hypothetical protein
MLGGGAAVSFQLSVVSFWLLAFGGQTLATKDGGTFVDVEIFV